LSRLIPDDWMPEAGMRRIICHWTVGNYNPTDFDKERYHILVDGDGKPHRGKHSIASNAPPLGPRYAAHTLNANSRAIGLSAACMAGARERPFDSGRCPLKREQWDAMAQAAAELCLRYGIDVTPTTVLQHGEVERQLGIRQNGKWDITRLPWDSVRTPEAVCNDFRTLVRAKLIALQGQVEQEETPPGAVVVIGAYRGEAIVTNGTTYARVRPLADAMGWRIEAASGDSVRLLIDGASVELPMILYCGNGHVSVRRLAEALGKGITWNPATREAVIG
jgi:hypothetical protein